MWQVNYETFGEHKIKGKLEVDSKETAMREFDKLYDAHEDIEIIVYDEEGFIYQSCTKGYE